MMRCFECGDFIRKNEKMIIANGNSVKLHNYHKRCYKEKRIE